MIFYQKVTAITFFFLKRLHISTHYSYLYILLEYDVLGVNVETINQVKDCLTKYISSALQCGLTEYKTSCYFLVNFINVSIIYKELYVGFILSLIVGYCIFRLLYWYISLLNIIDTCCFSLSSKQGQQ